MSELVTDTDGLGELAATAVFNAERTHRYVLTRAWGGGSRMCTFVMLNPSTADAFTLDRTVTRCIGFAQREGCDRLTVVNLFALRSTDPKVLYRHPDPVGGPANDTAIAAAAAHADVVIAAWGRHGTHLGRGAIVTQALALVGVPLHALAITKAGHPGHPLYLNADAPLVPYQPAATLSV